MEEARSFLRHTLATLAYRGAKVLREAPDDFSAFRVREGTRSPLEILAQAEEVRLVLVPALVPPVQELFLVQKLLLVELNLADRPVQLSIMVN